MSVVTEYAVGPTESQAFGRLKIPLWLICHRHHHILKFNNFFFIKMTANFYCVTCKKKTGTTKLSAHISVNNKKYIKGTCVICKNKKSCFVSDDEIAGAGLKDLFKKITRTVGTAGKQLGKNVISNPQRAFELGQQAAMAAISKNSALLGKTALDVGTFYRTGRGAEGRQPKAYNSVGHFVSGGARAVPVKGTKTTKGRTRYSGGGLYLKRER